ncbi:MAG: iron-containing alcohol dehydrogenase [Deltaproteobacteria bacterium]|nr:iron-containing alcohol dehydrogenase [Deltaproteobacteria bacterium]
MISEGSPSLRKFVAPEVIFGVGARHLAGRYARNLGARRVLVVTDPGVIAAGWVADVTASLDEEHLPWSLFSDVIPNPRDSAVMAGTEVYRAEGCNAIVAVGGGSPIDCAKGIGVVSSNRRHILEFEGVDRVSEPIPPLLCVPTTGGTSADVSQFAIITDTERRVKFAIITKAVVPDVALVDPLTLTTMPRWLASCSGLDALIHAIEAFVSNASSAMTDLHALEAIRLLAGNLELSIRNPQDIDLRVKVMQGSLQAGLAFSNASLGAVHAMAHSLGGLLDLPHGECNALVLEQVMAFNFAAAEDRFRRIGEALGLDLRGRNERESRSSILAEIHRLRGAMGLDETLGKRGVGRADIPGLAARAIADPCIVTNPRRPNRRDIEVVYEEAL